MRAVGVELLLAASLMWSTACAPAAKAPPRVAPAAKPVCAASNDQLVEAIRAVHDKQRNIGVQTAIHLDGRLVFSSGIGLADRERKIPVTRSTVFPVASVTKAFTGVATLKADAAGKIKLDDPVQRYVPEFPVKAEVVVTPRRLAAHRTGIRHWGPEREALHARHFDRLDEILPSFKDDPLRPKAGAEYQYSSYGYNLLALAVERATGVEFKEYVRSQVLQPLGLSKTRFDDARQPRPGMTKLYSFYDLKSFADISAEVSEPILVPVMDYSHNLAGGNMSLTAEDAVRFGAALLRPGFLPPSQHEMLFDQPSFGGKPSAMSFGFFAQEAGEERRLTISGSNQGFQAGLIIYPERKLAVAVLSNTWGVGSRSGEMTSDLPKRLAELCAPLQSAKAIAEAPRAESGAVPAGQTAAAAPSSAPPAPQQAQATAYQFINGRWFDGKSFRQMQLYSAGGRFTISKPRGAVQTIDLNGQYVVPPFGEAHNHNIEYSRSVPDATIAKYLRDGVFYVKNPNNLPRSRTLLAGRINVPDSIDVTYSNGGLIGSGGHPIDIATRNIARGTWAAADAEGGFYYTIDSLSDLDAKWPAIVGGRPDFIKTYLLYSEEYEKRKADPSYGSWKGLNPALLPEITRRAHAAGLRVSTHVETAADFRSAVAAKVDEINHLPGFRPDRNDWRIYRNLEPYRLTDTDARLAAEKGVTVVTTISGVVEQLAKAKPGSEEAALLADAKGLLAANVRTLRRYGVSLAIGSDEYSETSAIEARSLARLGTIDNLSLLKMWSEATPKAIFPNRKIGKLAPGYEASFLVLPSNPLIDFTATQQIGTRVKQGYLLPTGTR